MSIKDIIKETIEKLSKETQLSDEKIDLLMQKAEIVDKLAGTIEGQCKDLVESSNGKQAQPPTLKEFEEALEQEPFESEMNFRGRIEDKTQSNHNPDAYVIGEGGALRDTGTYWWRGLPVEVEVSWFDGTFTLELFKQDSDKRCGHYSMKLSKMIAFIECSSDENLKAALGTDYDRMFSNCCDRHDTSHPQG